MKKQFINFTDKIMFLKRHHIDHLHQGHNRNKNYDEQDHLY
jgi:hypothetical protein